MLRFRKEILCGVWMLAEVVLLGSLSIHATVASVSAATGSSGEGTALAHQSGHKPPRGIPLPLPEHPGNIFVEGQEVSVRIPATPGGNPVVWRLQNDRFEVVRPVELSAEAVRSNAVVHLDKLGIGWYRLVAGTNNQSEGPFTTLAVLPRLRAPTPYDSPICVDSAAAWFARDDVVRQKELANLAALAGVNWVRDRLRWRDIQPAPGELKMPPTTYDTSARVHHEAGLQVLQVFHDTPPWAADGPEATSRFAPDLRRAYALCRALALRFKDAVDAWEPWNEANVATFGGHTVDQMCSWQKAAWLGFKAGNPDVIVGWNVTAAIPTPAHTEGVLANGTWPYFDTYNIHTYDWPEAYNELWKPAREASAGRPIWITEADRGTPHLKNPPWYDQDPRLERLKAEWIAQAYASSLFAGAKRHFHFILGNYQEPNGIQFGLLRLDLTPRPGYVALAAVGRWLAGARALGRWQPLQNVHVYAFRGCPDGEDRDVLVVWAEKAADWNDRGELAVDWSLPTQIEVEKVVDYLGRLQPSGFPKAVKSDPVFVVLPRGEAAKLPLEAPPATGKWLSGEASLVVLQLAIPRSAQRRVEDLKWSEGFAYEIDAGKSLNFKLFTYNFSPNKVEGRLSVVSQPKDWATTLSRAEFSVDPMGRSECMGNLQVPVDAAVRDGWVQVTANHGQAAESKLAFRVVPKR